MARRSKLLIIAGSFTLLVLIAVALLISSANKIIKNQLEKALGENFKVARIGLSWGTVEAEGVKFLKDGKVEASAKKVGIRADFLTIFRKNVVVSALVLEEPVLATEIDESGGVHTPLPPEIAKETKEGEAPKTSQLSVHVKKLSIKNGTFYFRDRRLKEPNRLEARQVNLNLSNLSYPISDTLSDIDLKTNLTGKLFSGSLSVTGTLNAVRQSFNVALDGEKLAAVDLPGSGPQARIGKISFRAACQGLTANPVEVTDVNVEKPYMRLLVDKNGDLVTPLRNIAPAENKGVGKPAGPAQKAPPRTYATIKKLKIIDGEVLLVDAKVRTPPHTLRMTDVSVTVDQLAIPGRNDWSSFECALSVPGEESTGLLRASGNIRMESLDTLSKVSLQGLDLNAVKPYVQKSGEADLSRGILNMDMDLRVDKRTLHAPTKAVLRNLEFAPSKGAGETFMSLPRSAVVSFLKTNNNEIRLDFVVEGNLDDPKFTLRESTARKFALQLGKTLGIGVLGAGESIIDVTRKGLKGAGDTVKETTKGLKKLFK
jgi:uncharacterized protein involved in outer membrane biogenesis